MDLFVFLYLYSLSISVKDIPLVLAFPKDGNHPSLTSVSGRLMRQHGVVRVEKTRLKTEASGHKQRPGIRQNLGLSPGSPGTDCET